MALVFVFLFVIIILFLFGLATKSKWLMIITLSIILGSITYLFIGSSYDSLLEGERFFSFPFGGYELHTPGNIFLSLLIWFAVWGAIVIYPISYWLKKIDRPQYYEYEDSENHLY